jgi:hypothetical protein
LDQPTAAHRRIAGCRFTAQPRQIEGGVDHAHQMIARNSPAKVELVKQLALIALEPSNHGERSLMFSQQDGITAYHLPRRLLHKICTSAFKIRHPTPACASNDRSRNHPFSCLP